LRRRSSPRFHLYQTIQAPRLVHNKMGKGGDGKGNGLTIEICEGITEHANRVALKGVFSAFGDVLACWVPPIDRRGVDSASVRFAAAESAECAKTACDAGQVFFQGLPLKVKWRAGGGPRVGNSDIGGTAGGNSPTRQALGDAKGGKGERRDGGRDRSRGRRGDRRSRSRDRRRDRDGDRSRRDEPREKREFDSQPLPAGGAEPFNPLADVPGMGGMPPMMGGMPPEMIMQGMIPPMGGVGGPSFPGDLAPPMIQMPEPPQVHIPSAEELAAAARRKQELREERQRQMKRGPGVAALVQGALKKVQTTSDQKRQEQQVFEEMELAKAKKNKPQKSEAEKEAERKQKEKEDRERLERMEREALEREKEKAKQRAIEAKKEEERLQEEAVNRELRVKAGVEAAKKQQAVRENRMTTGGKAVAGPENLYGDMPGAGNEPQDDANEKRRKDEARRAAKNFNLPPEDKGKIVFLDIDGVLRPARAGGFDILSEGKETVQTDTSDFFPSAMKALRHIIERTGAVIVLSSEWRRNEALREAIDDVLEANRIRPSWSFTATDIDAQKMSDPVRSFADRRAREVSAYLANTEDIIKGWVVLDDINLAIVDEEKKADTKSMAPKLVQTWPLCGLTMGNAKTAVRILNGEMINKVLVERPKAPHQQAMGGQVGVAPA